LCKWEGKENGKNDLKSSSSLPLHAQGRRRTVPFKTACFSVLLFFFFMKRNVIWKKKIGSNPKMGYDRSRHPVFWSLGTLTDLRDRVQRLVA